MCLYCGDNYMPKLNTLRIFGFSVNDRILQKEVSSLIIFLALIYVL